MKYLIGKKRREGHIIKIAEYPYGHKDKGIWDFVRTVDVLTIKDAITDAVARSNWRDRVLEQDDRSAVLRHRSYDTTVIYRVFLPTEKHKIRGMH